MKILIALLQYLPAILSGVKAVEDENIPGVDKKQLVLNAVQAAAKAGEVIPESHVTGISALIDFTVASLKSSGVFTSKVSPT